MTDAQDREISTYSKGMRQRVKMASALVHDPSVLLLDEPFNGMDPRQRMQLMDLLRRMGDEGRTVLFSSHILEEVEQLAGHIEVMVAGRHAASGDFREIRRLMTDRPHRYPVRSSDDRALAAALIADRSASAVELVAAPRRPAGRPRWRRRSAPGTAPAPCTSRPSTSDASCACCRSWPAHTASGCYEVSPSDESLESVFSYLVAR